MIDVCDFVPGELIFSFPDDPDVSELMSGWIHEHGEYEHVNLLTTMQECVDRLEVPPESRTPSPRQLWLIGVPPGQEYFKMNWLRQVYQSIIWSHRNELRQPIEELLLDVAVVPNAHAHLTGPPVLPPAVTLTDWHSAYLKTVGIGGFPPVSDATVAIVDSGIAATLEPLVWRTANVLRVSRRGAFDADVNDRLGHGTVVASIVTDVAPGARLVIYKVADTGVAPTEWDVILSLRTLADADVVNLSLAFGFAKKDCRACGRQSYASRSMVFENELASLAATPKQPIVVAAAGNDGADLLSYPARFHDVVAVGSVTQSGVRSSFSNAGAIDHVGDPHPHLFFLPGGETAHDRQEWVAYRADQRKNYQGTSFACAYASGLISVLRTWLARADLLQHLRNTAVGDVVDGHPARPGTPFNAERYGNGRMRFVHPD